MQIVIVIYCLFTIAHYKGCKYPLGLFMLIMYSLSILFTCLYAKFDITNDLYKYTTIPLCMFGYIASIFFHIVTVSTSPLCVPLWVAIGNWLACLFGFMFMVVPGCIVLLENTKEIIQVSKNTQKSVELHANVLQLYSLYCNKEDILSLPKVISYIRNNPLDSAEVHVIADKYSGADEDADRNGGDSVINDFSHIDLNTETKCSTCCKNIDTEGDRKLVRMPQCGHFYHYDCFVNRACHNPTTLCSSFGCNKHIRIQVLQDIHKNLRL